MSVPDEAMDAALRAQRMMREKRDAECIRRAKELMRCKWCKWWNPVDETHCCEGDGPYFTAQTDAMDGCLEWEAKP